MFSQQPTSQGGWEAGLKEAKLLSRVGAHSERAKILGFTYETHHLPPCLSALAPLKQNIPYFAKYNAQFFAQIFEGKLRMRIVHVVLVMYLYKCFKFFYLCLCIKSVTLKSNNNIHMQNNTLEYDNWLCFQI